VDLKGWLNKENKIRSLLRILFFFYASKCSNQSLWHFAGKGQDYLAVVLRGWLNKENKIRSLLRILFFFYASKCSNQSLWHFVGKETGLPSGGPKGMA
jgi:hypothetical protein